MIYKIENSDLSLKINSAGAEITSLTYKNKELIWQAQPVWQRHAPILFPIVGKLKNNQFLHNNKIYCLPQHGFARDKEWLCTLKSENIIEFELTDDDATYQQYPFHFSLIVRYEIKGTSIYINFKVFNPYHTNLPFSLGFHPAFNTFGDLNRCYLKIISDKNTFERTLLISGLLSSLKEKINLTDSKLNLCEKMFDRDAIVIESSDIRAIRLGNAKWNYEIEVGANTCKNWGIWTKHNCSDFVCIEPWMGIADTENATGDLFQKKDIIILASYQSWEWKLFIKVLEKIE